MKKCILSASIFVLSCIGVFAHADTGGIMPYDADFIPPPGFLKMVDDTENPQEMVIIQEENSEDSYDFVGMQEYVPAENYALPTTALKDTLITSNRSTTRIVQGENQLVNFGNRPDWVSDPVESETYELMIVDGDAYGISFTANNDSSEAKIRLIYTGPSFAGYGCVNYSGANYIGAVVLAEDGTPIGCNQPGMGDEDLIPLGGVWEERVSYWLDEWDELTARLGFACDDCWIGSDGDEGDEAIPLGFEINYYGTVYDEVFVNSNGSVSFGAGSDEYDQPLDEILGESPGICAYCLDLENDDQIYDVLQSEAGRSVSGAAVRHSDFIYRGRSTFEGRPAFAATWMNVPTYSSDDEDGTWNTFQIMFVDIDDETDDVDIIINYGSMRNEDEQGYCGGDEEEEMSCNLVAIGLGTVSGDNTIYNSIVNDSGLVLNGMSTQALRDEGSNPLREQHLNSDIPGRFIFEMRDGILPGSEINAGPGCTDSQASNYSEYASEDDGTCVYPVDNLAAGDTTQTQITISWTHALSGAIESLDSYTVHTASGSIIYSGLSTETTGIVVGGLTINTTYTITVCSIYYINEEEVQACTSISHSTAGSSNGGSSSSVSSTQSTSSSPEPTETESEEETTEEDNEITEETITPIPTPETPKKTMVKTFSEEVLFNPDIPDGFCFERKNDVEIIDSELIKTTTEFKTALAFLNSYGMTIFNEVDAFQIYDPMTRAQAAKMFSNFATNVLCRKPADTTITYTDTENADSTLTPYILKAYQLGLMKGSSDGKFRPNDIITKAEFNAVLIRMILKSYLDENSEVWYDTYNDVATNLGVITQGAGENPVSRHDATLMLFRAYKDQAFSLQDIEYESFVLKNRAEIVDKNK